MASPLSLPSLKALGLMMLICRLPLRLSLNSCGLEETRLSGISFCYYILIEQYQQHTLYYHSFSYTLFFIGLVKNSCDSYRTQLRSTWIRETYFPKHCWKESIRKYLDNGPMYHNSHTCHHHHLLICFISFTHRHI